MNTEYIQLDYLILFKNVFLLGSFLFFQVALILEGFFLYEYVFFRKSFVET